MVCMAGTLKWSRVDEGLLLSGFCPDSQNIHSDAPKISIISEHSKFFETFLQKKHEIEQFLSIYLYLCIVQT